MTETYNTNQESNNGQNNEKQHKKKKKNSIVIILLILLIEIFSFVLILAAGKIVVAKVLEPRGYSCIFSFFNSDSKETKIEILYSPDHKKQLILKEFEQELRETTRLRRKWIFFYKEDSNRTLPETEKNKFLQSGEYKVDWIENDICLITYKDKSTEEAIQYSYSCRSENTISYEYLNTAIRGTWDSEDSQTSMLVKDSNLTLTMDGRVYIYDISQGSQYGISVETLEKESFLGSSGKSGEQPAISITLSNNVKKDHNGIALGQSSVIINIISMDKVSYIVLTKENDDEQDQMEEDYLKSLDENSDSENTDSVATDVQTKNCRCKIERYTVYVTYDNGITWKETPISEKVLETSEYQAASEEVAEGSYYITPDLTVFVYGEKALLCISRDSGKTWTNQSLPNEDISVNYRNFIGFSDSENGYIIVTGDRTMRQVATICYTTADGGNTWTKQGSPGFDGVSFIPSSAIFSSEKTGFLFLENMDKPGGFMTTDGGVTWADFTLPEETGKEGWFTVCYDPVFDGAKGQVTAGQYEYAQNKGMRAVYTTDDYGITWTLDHIIEN